MDHVDGDEPAPPILRTAFLCRKWGSLPEVGAMFDQDYGMITGMNAVLNIHSTLTRLRAAVGDQIHQLSASELKLIGWLKKNRMI